MKNKISVVLGSYNRCEFLKLTIDSVREELKNSNYEIIVVDGGSDDGALQWLLQQKDIVTIVQHNRGNNLWCKKVKCRSWGYFMNLGFKCAQGKYVCMLSDDCLVVPGAIKNGYEVFEKKLNGGNNVGAVAFYFRDWGKQKKYHVGFTLGLNMYVNHGLYLNDALKAVDYIDESFDFYNADGDLCLKMKQVGYSCITSENSYVEHYPHANVAVRKTNESKYKNDLKKYLKKWMGIFYDKKTNILGKIKEKEFEDFFKTGDRFINFKKIKWQENIPATKKFSLKNWFK